MALTWTTNIAKHLIIIVNFILIAAFISRFYFDKVLSDLNESVQIKKEILKQYAGFEKDYKNLQAKIIAIKTIESKDQMIEKLDSLNQSIPGTVKLTNMTYSANQISFSAELPTKENLDQLVENLKQLSFVKSVTVPEVKKENATLKSVQASFILNTSL